MKPSLRMKRLEGTEGKLVRRVRDHHRELRRRLVERKGWCPERKKTA